MAALVLCLAGASAIALWAARPDAQQGWVKHANPMGFVLEHPTGWTVAKTKFDAIVVRSPEKSVFAVILPFSMDGPGSAQQAITTLPGILLAPQFPGAEIRRVKQLSAKPDLAIAETSFKAGDQACRGSLMCLILGTNGTIYGIAAPQGTFEKSKPTLVRILNSFRFAQPQKTATPEPRKPAQSIEFVTWKDPTENAFTMKVPKGWSISGGMIRRGATDARPAVQMESPDKDMAVLLGNGEFPYYVTPSRLDMQFGLPEGSDAGCGMVRMRYLTGAEAAKAVIMTKLPRAGFADLKFSDAKDYPELAQAANAALQQQGLQASQSYGSISFTGEQKGKRVKGFCFTATQRSNLGLIDQEFWSIQLLAAYVAVEGKEQIAEAVMCQANSSFQPNAQWVAGSQRAMDAHIRSHQSASASGSSSSDELYESYKRRSQADDEMARKRSNAILGQTDVRDTETGQTWKAEAGHNYYWRASGTDDIVGTRGPDRPANDIDFTPLEEY